MTIAKLQSCLPEHWPPLFGRQVNSKTQYSNYKPACQANVLINEYCLLFGACYLLFGAYCPYLFNRSFSGA